jgi:WhiB family transcriptional regulator, redox-sensing transcriptional regulator
MSSDCNHTAHPGAALLPAHPPGAAVRVLRTAVLRARVGAAGLCADAGDDRCYPDHISAHARRRLTEYARQRCSGCPVAEECLELALRIETQKTRSSWGIWGGTTPGERRAMLRDRTQARAALPRLAVAP